MHIHIHTYIHIYIYIHTLQDGKETDLQKMVTYVWLAPQYVMRSEDPTYKVCTQYVYVCMYVVIYICSSHMYRICM